MTSKPTEQLLTLKDLAGILRKSTRWVRDQVHAGEIQALRLGQELRFRWADIEAYLGEKELPSKNGGKPARRSASGDSE